MNARNLSRLLFLILICVCCVANAMAQVRLTSGEADKLLLKAAEAKYPTEVPIRPKGVVTIEATISETGIVTSAKAIEGHPYLLNAAETAVRKYKYKPHAVDGKPVSFTTEVYVGFPPDLLRGKLREEFDGQRQLGKQYFKVKPECKKLSSDNNWKDIEEACRELVRIADQLSQGDLEKIDAYETLGKVLVRQQRYEEALDCFNRALIPLLSEDTALAGRLYGNVAATHHLLGQLEKAREFYRRAEKIFEDIYEAAAKAGPNDLADELKTSSGQQLRRLLEVHLKAAEESGATAEVAEIQRRLKIYQ